jgi:hypothetical protein
VKIVEILKRRLIVKSTFPRLFVSILLLLGASAVVLAQGSQNAAPSLETASHSALSQNVPVSVANLPEADTLIYINTQRILNEAAPRLMPEKELAEMRKAFGEMKQFSGVDPTKVDYLVIAVRSRKPSADLNFMPPEFMALASGDFSADSLVVLARMASDGKLRDEKYGAKTISLMTIDPIAKEAVKNPILKSFSEVAIVPLNDNTIAVGTPAYLKAAVDAVEGNGRISSESLNSLLRDPDALVSIAGSPWDSFARSFGLLGTEANPRAPKWDSNLGDFYAAITMDAANFMLRGAMGADNPDTAKIINNLLSGLLRQASSHIPDKTGQSVMNMLSLTAKDNEVVLQADIPQQMVIDFVKEQMKPKKQATGIDTKPPAKKPVARRKPRRKS